MLLYDRGSILSFLTSAAGPSSSADKSDCRRAKSDVALTSDLARHTDAVADLPPVAQHHAIGRRCHCSMQMPTMAMAMAPTSSCEMNVLGQLERGQ